MGDFGNDYFGSGVGFQDFSDDGPAHMGPPPQGFRGGPGGGGRGSPWRYVD